MQLNNTGKMKLSEMLLAMLMDLVLKALENLAFFSLEAGCVWSGHEVLDVSIPV